MVRLDGCTAGTVTAVELLTVTEGITIGLAETREASRKGRMEGRCMAFAAEGVFLSSLFFFSEKGEVVLIAEDADGGGKRGKLKDKWR